jgi:hypothetical protein
MTPQSPVNVVPFNPKVTALRVVPKRLERVLRGLERLDAEQIQIIEIMVAAIARGAL